MKYPLTLLKGDVAVVATAFLLYVGSFQVNQFLASYAVLPSVLGLMFLPAGVKLLTLLWGRLPAAMGLFIAHVYLDGPLWPLSHDQATYYLSATSVGSYVLAVFLLMRWQWIHENLSNLRYGHLVGFSLAASVLNGLLQSLVSMHPDKIEFNDYFWTHSAQIAFGDFLGCFAIVVIFNAAIITFDEIRKYVCSPKVLR
jgi:hypothetical protein